MSDTVDDVRDEVEGLATDRDLAGWVKKHYDAVCAACDDRNIPRPPPWREPPLIP